LNHPNFGSPINYLTSPQFGQATQMLNSYLGSGGQSGDLNPLYQIGRSAIDPAGTQTSVLNIRLHDARSAGQSLTIFNGVDANLDGNITDWAELIGNPLSAHLSAGEWFNTAVCKENPNRTLNAPLALVGCLWASRRSAGSNPP
jgi:hypothetical protein